jgi:hypothetical protein
MFWAVMMTNAKDAIAQSAEQAIRDLVRRSDQPLLRLEALAQELALVIEATSRGKRDKEADAVADIVAGLQTAITVIWAEEGGHSRVAPQIAPS